MSALKLGVNASWPNVIIFLQALSDNVRALLNFVRDSEQWAPENFFAPTLGLNPEVVEYFLTPASFFGNAAIFFFSAFKPSAEVKGKPSSYLLRLLWDIARLLNDFCSKVGINQVL